MRGDREFYSLFQEAPGDGKVKTGENETNLLRYNYTEFLIAYEYVLWRR